MEELSELKKNPEEVNDEIVLYPKNWTVKHHIEENKKIADNI